MGDTMNIHIISTIQCPQRAANHAREGNVTPGESLSAVAPGNCGVKPDSALAESVRVASLIGDLQRDLEADPTVVFDPPFFPIATYQRLELIQKVRNTEEEVDNSSLNQGMKEAISGSHLRDEATDREISAALGGLFAFRDRLTERGPASLEEMQPGSILEIKA